jgi:hypothetical protein
MSIHIKILIGCQRINTRGQKLIFRHWSPVISIRRWAEERLLLIDPWLTNNHLAFRVSRARIYEKDIYLQTQIIGSVVCWIQLL